MFVSAFNTIVEPLLIPFVIMMILRVICFKNKDAKSSIKFLILFFCCIPISILFFLSPLPVRFFRDSLFLLVDLSLYIILIVKILRMNKPKEKADTSNDATSSSDQIVIKSSLLLWISVLLVIISFPLFNGFQATIPDVPAALAGHTQTVSGTLESLRESGGNMDFFLKNNSNELLFLITKNDFNPLAENSIYTIEYFPHSDYVVDIQDAAGKSLRK